MIDKSQSNRGIRMLGVFWALTVALLALNVARADAHGVISPPVAKSGTLQQFSLSVPTEKEKATTTKIELDVPSGFALDSYEPAPGWKRSVTQKGSGENAVVQKVVWSGGRVPTEEDSVFHFNADATKSKTYKFRVEQTYSDGSVVDWSGPEKSDTPAPTVEAKSSLGGGGGGKTLALIAIILAAVAIVLGAVAAAGGRRSLT
jgi:uncharacterized protein YcnI